MEIDIYGASGHAKVIVEIIEDLGYTIKRIIDDHSDQETLFQYKIYREPIAEHLFFGIGNNHIRYFLAHSFENKKFPILIHPRTILSKRAAIGAGTVVMPNVTINSEVSIGQHCIINTSASIDHECQISDFVHISPNVALAGNVEVGEGTHIGIGASVIQGIKIGKWCTIGAGAVIIRDVPDYAVVVGNPGKVIKYNNQ